MVNPFLNPFTCGENECELCNQEEPFTEEAVQHCLENGVRQGILKEVYDKKSGELSYIETDKGKKLRGKNGN